MQKVRFETKLPPASTLIAQPPADVVTGEAAMHHYTWGSIWTDNGTKVWEFDKRSYTDAKFELEVRSTSLSHEWQAVHLCCIISFLRAAVKPPLITMTLGMDVQ